MITPQNICRHELVGLYVKIHSSSNPAQIGIEGVITDETKQMLIISTRGGSRSILKSGTHLDLNLPDDTLVRVDGSVLVMLPEKRVSMRIRNPR